jgi:hypothetical protein
MNPTFERIWLAHRYALLVSLTGSIFLPLYHPRTVLTPDAGDDIAAAIGGSYDA